MEYSSKLSSYALKYEPPEIETCKDAMNAFIEEASEKLNTVT